MTRNAIKLGMYTAYGWSLGIVALSGSMAEAVIRLGLTFIPQPLIDSKGLAVLLQKQPEHFRLLPSGRLMMTLPTAVDLSPVDFLRAVREAIGRLPILAVRG